MFPGIESDFFRNRLTHSLEVAQIAKSIAIKLNAEESDFFNRVGPIDTDLVEVAGLAHDLGHPPFGHNGELALDRCMLPFGGFEGNAQTLRILARLEKKVTDDGEAYGVIGDIGDRRFGLDMCARTLASVLKYDREIPPERNIDRKSAAKPFKGHYASESELVSKIKAAVIGHDGFTDPFKTLECQIMDIADDIAYSTYDLEDAFKAKFLAPIDLLAADNALLSDVADEINRNAEPSECVDNSKVRGMTIRVFEEFLRDAELEERIESKQVLTNDDLRKI